MSKAVIVSAVRTAMGKGRKGTLRTVRPDDLGALVIGEAVKRATGLQSQDVDDVLMGCAIPEGEQGMNVARVASLRAGLPASVPAATINRFCSSGLQTIAMAVDAVASGRAHAVVAGGTESMSRVAMFARSYPNPQFAKEWPGVYLAMGLTAENLAKQYGISREESDAFSLQSHQKAAGAIVADKFAAEIVPVPVEIHQPSINGQGGNGQGGNGQGGAETINFAVDECPRANATLEGLAKLRPVFAAKGTVTAGNASQMSDGAAAVVVMSEEKAKELGLKPLARLVSFAVAGVPPEVMGIGPVVAVPKALEQAGLSLDDIDIIELNEAFSVQALSVIKELGLPLEKVNVNGGAVALGHPLGATGARLVVTALNELERRGARRALITMCVGGGMGAAGIIER
jgi:acetyl-CoA acyltransferase